MSEDGTERESQVIVLDIEELVLDEAYNRGLDPTDLEVVESISTDQHELSVLVESSLVHAETDGYPELLADEIGRIILDEDNQFRATILDADSEYAHAKADRLDETLQALAAVTKEGDAR